MKELPEKIVMDYNCEMTPLQSKMYELINDTFPIIQETKSNDQKKQKTSYLENLSIHVWVLNDPSLIYEDDNFYLKLVSKHKSLQSSLKEFK